MIDNRIHFREPLVGSCHPYLPDTLNRLALVEANPSGHGRVRWLAGQAQPPLTGPGEVALYCRPVMGRLELFMRREANGAEVPLTGELSGHRAGPPFTTPPAAFCGARPLAEERADAGQAGHC